MSYVYLKNLVLLLVSPTSFSLLMLLVGLLFLWGKTNQKIGKILVTCGCLYLLLGSLPFLPDSLLKHIERHYAPYAMDDSGKNELSDVKFIVVLAGGHVLHQELPITSQFTYEGLVRLIEGIRLYRIIPEASLILSSGRGEDPVSNAELMKDIGVALGLSQENLILETESRSSFDQARFVQSIVREESFLLVTSASHMLRSMALFKKLGMNPIAAPTGHLVKHYGNGISLFPNALNLRKTDILFYEILGLIKEKIMSRI